MQWVELTHKLESAPLDDSVNKQGEAGIQTAQSPNVCSASRLQY